MIHIPLPPYDTGDNTQNCLISVTMVQPNEQRGTEQKKPTFSILFFFFNTSLEESQATPEQKKKLHFSSKRFFFPIWTVESCVPMPSSVPS